MTAESPKESFEGNFFKCLFSCITVFFCSCSNGLSVHDYSAMFVVFPNETLIVWAQESNIAMHLGIVFSVAFGPSHCQ